MKGLVGDFVWRVPKAGFRSMTCRYRRPNARIARGGLSFVSFHGPHEDDFRFHDLPNDFLVPVVPDTDEFPSGVDFDVPNDVLPFVLSGSSSREYEPIIEYPALFREFAMIDSGGDGIFAFANRWGALGSEGTCVIMPVDESDSERPNRRIIWGEVIEIWELEIFNMFNAISIWDAARHHDEKLLKTRIWWVEGKVYWRPDPGRWDSVVELYVATSDYHPERIDPIRQDGLERAGLYLVQDLVNEGLRSRVHEELQWDEATGKPTIRIVPGNLIGAMWLQFALAIDGDNEFGKCSECASWYVIAPGAGRPDKTYCSNACRMRAYRKRKTAKKGRKKKTVYQTGGKK